MQASPDRYPTRASLRTPGGGLASSDLAAQRPLRRGVAPSGATCSTTRDLRDVDHAPSASSQPEPGRSPGPRRSGAACEPPKLEGGVRRATLLTLCRARTSTAAGTLSRRRGETTRAFVPTWPRSFDASSLGCHRRGAAGAASGGAPAATPGRPPASDHVSGRAVAPDALRPSAGVRGTSRVYCAGRSTLHTDGTRDRKLWTSAAQFGRSRCATASPVAAAIRRPRHRTLRVSP